MAATSHHRPILGMGTLLRRIGASCGLLVFLISTMGDGSSFTTITTAALATTYTTTTTTAVTSSPSASTTTEKATSLLHHHHHHHHSVFSNDPLRGGGVLSRTKSLSAASSSVDADVVVEDPGKNTGPMKILFLSSDTGGGHRASAEALAKQFQLLYPGSTYELADLWTDHGCVPYRLLVGSYKHLSAHPRQWRFLYHLSNTSLYVWGMVTHSTLMCERKIRRRIADFDPDVVVSVHPTMNYAPSRSTRKISSARDKHIPFFTVVTDLGSGHATWFHNKVDKVYLASESMQRLAKRRGRTPDEKIVMAGLPIRNDFAVRAEQLGDRTADAGSKCQDSVKTELGLSTAKPMILVMGGGEGVGGLEQIVDELYACLKRGQVDATICVVCGRNEKLKSSLAEKDWDAVLAKSIESSTKPKRRRRLLSWLRRRRKGGSDSTKSEAVSANAGKKGNGDVEVVGLGFVTNMADYMVASDILVSKAGPGTIAEAAAVGLPVMLTSFLPGQEAGNVDFVLEKGFGDYNRDPVAIADTVTAWLLDPNKLAAMSHAASEAGTPHAAKDIVADIGSITQTWMALNDGKVEVAAP